MSDDRYARVRFSIMDDPKFDGIRETPALLGSWVLCLVVAEMAWPSPAFPPPWVTRSAFAHLVDAGLVDPMPNGCYRIHGLDAERSRRKDQAVHASNARWNAPSSPRSNAPASEGAMPSKAAQSRDDQRTDEQGAPTPLSTPNPYLPDGDTDALDVYHELTGYRPWGEFSGNDLNGAIREYGNLAVEEALREEYAKDGDRKTLLKRSMVRLARSADHARREAATPHGRRRKVEADEARRQEILREITGGAA